MNFRILNNSFVRMHNFQLQVAEAVKFLNKNPQCIIDNINKQHILNQKTLINSPIETIYTSIRDLGLDEKFALVDFTHVVSGSAPDIFNLTIVPIFINDHQLVVNITPFIKRRRFAEDRIILSDIGLFHSLIVRGMLMTSYEQFLADNTKNDVWIGHNIVIPLAISYSMIMTYLIPMSQDMKDVETVKTIFVWFFMARVQKTDKLQELSNPPLLYQCKINLSKMEIDNVLHEFLKDFDLNSEMSLRELSHRIKKVVPTVPKNFDDAWLLRRFTGGHKNVNELMVGISYPPYWLFHILTIVSGAKDPHTTLLKKFRLYDQMLIMTSRLLKSKGFLTKIK